MKSLYSQNNTATKCRPITCTNLRESNFSLPIVDDSCSSTRTHNIFASQTVSIESDDPPSYWYNVSSNNEGSVCELLT